AQIKLLVELESLVTDYVLLEVKLDPPAFVLQISETRLAMDALGNEPAGQADLPAIELREHHQDCAAALLAIVTHMAKRIASCFLQLPEFLQLDLAVVTFMLLRGFAAVQLVLIHGITSGNPAGLTVSGLRD